MQIDRSRFLWIAAALAGSAGAGVACTTVTDTAVDGGASNNDAGSKSDATTGDGAVDGGGGDAADGSDGATGCSIDEADGGVVTRCDEAFDGGCLATPTGKTICQAYYDNLKSGLADKAFDCLAQFPSCESGFAPDGGAITCGRAALSMACSDPTAATFCQELAGVCTDAGVDAGFSLTDCESAVRGLVNGTGGANGRSAIRQCFSCAEGGLLPDCLAQYL